jgi:histidinol dehydrogenase
MIQTIDLRGLKPSRAELLDLVPRSHTDVAAATAVATELIADVRDRGEAALIDQAARLDGVRPDRVRLDVADVSAAVRGLRTDVRDALEEAIDRVRAASRAQLPTQTVTRLGPGAEVMNVVPAQVAGVSSIALASPPQKDFGGSIHPTILGAAGLLGIDEVYAMGGAGAIGAFAWGVPGLGLDPVQVITGPGNVYVAAAKRLVRGQVGIDAEAGPTEILVIADDTANAFLVASDLLSQAEHDELAAAVLVTDSVELAERVRAELERIAPLTPHRARVDTALRGRQSAVVLVDDLEAAAAFSNVYGPEHLEIQTADPDAVLDLIESAGAIFLGDNSPVSLGDYLAGSNHVLPTGGQARFTPGLGAYTFLRPQQVIRYDREALRDVEAKIVALATAEDLPAHAAAVTARFSEG